MIANVGTIGRCLRMPLLYGNFVTAFVNRAKPYKESDEIVLYRLRNGVQLVAAPGPCDVKIINEIWIDEDYGAPGFVPEASWNVVDLGANKGYYSAWALTRAPTTRVHCYEPDPRNFEALCRNLAPFASRVQTHRAAVGGSAGSVMLFRHAGQAGQGSIYRVRAEDRGNIVAKLEVEILALGDVLAGIGIVDLLKVDVEGAEYEILLGCPSEVLNNVQRIAMEADARDPSSPERDADDLAGYLASVGLREKARRRTVRFFGRE